MKNDHRLLGIGNDIIEIERIEQSIKQFGDRFLERHFTAKERAYCLKNSNPYPQFAGRFSAKEAAAKALGTGFGEHLSWKDLEILPGEHGKPELFFHGALALQHPNTRILVSISHCKLYATAMAIWMQEH